MQDYSLFKDAVDTTNNELQKVKDQMNRLPRKYLPSTESVIKTIEKSIKPAIDNHFNSDINTPFDETINTFISIVKFINVIYDINNTRIQHQQK